MKVISVVNSKGGTGKTTISVNVATRLAMLGNKVLLVDMDEKQNSSLKVVEIRNGNAELSPISAVTMKAKSLYKDIQNYSNFDFIVVDAGAGDNELTRATVACATFGMLLIPLKASGLDYWVTDDVLNTLEEWRSYFTIDNTYLLLNEYDPKQNMAKGIKEAIDEACGKYQVKVMETKILNRVAYKESLLNGMNVIEYAEVKRHTEKAAAELEALVNEILKILK